MAGETQVSGSGDAAWPDGSVAPNVITYNSLISACEKGNNLAKATELFDMLQRDNCEPTVITYNAMMSACARGRDLEKAQELFDAMQQKEIRPDAVSYNALISACEKSRQPERALGLLDQMQENRVTPTIVSWSTAITACEKSRQPERALELFEAMLRQGCTPDTITYNALISSCEKGRQADTALLLFEQMQGQRLVPDVVTFNALLSACEKGGQLDKRFPRSSFALLRLFHPQLARSSLALFGAFMAVAALDAAAALAPLVRAAAEGAAAGGAARHGIAAAVAAAARVGAELTGGWAADGAGDEEDAELALRLRAIRPALARLIRGERASGAERATRNLGAHAFLGEGAEVLEAALERPQASQRRGRSGALAPTDLGAVSHPPPKAGWRPSLEARRCSMAPPTDECGYNGDAKNDDDGHQQHVDEQQHVQLHNQYEIKYGVGDEELEGYGSGPDEVRFESKPELGKCAGDGAQDDDSRHVDDDTLGDACTGEDGLCPGEVQAPLGTQHDEPSDAQDEGEYEECTDADLGAGGGAAATEAAEPATYTAWRTAARRGRAATRGTAFVLADRVGSAPEARWQWRLEELGRDGGPKAPSACPPTTAVKGVECERDSADDDEAANDEPLGIDPSEYTVKHDGRMQPGVAQQDLQEKVGIGSAGPTREVHFEEECTWADSQRVQEQESEAQDKTTSEPALAETPMRVGTQAVSEHQSDANQQRDSEQPEEQQQFPSERAELAALRARYNGLVAGVRAALGAKLRAAREARGRR
ncbi:unnamed protein product [Prorocentrum cordatum]|uniref:Pentacotripeptide-repeat region of PRORP domain-containing protein n=1 Tax=Prorocentrum cordatum TaxID=2364126 RepID=A0ABN9V7M5_9DINO|nr:unnamed protein product [Polarella glacialis]